MSSAVCGALLSLCVARTNVLCKRAKERLAKFARQNSLANFVRERNSKFVRSFCAHKLKEQSQECARRGNI